MSPYGSFTRGRRQAFCRVPLKNPGYAALTCPFTPRQAGEGARSLPYRGLPLRYITRSGEETTLNRSAWRALLAYKGGAFRGRGRFARVAGVVVPGLNSVQNKKN